MKAGLKVDIAIGRQCGKQMHVSVCFFCQNYSALCALWPLLLVQFLTTFHNKVIYKGQKYYYPISNTWFSQMKMNTDFTASDKEGTLHYLCQ